MSSSSDRSAVHTGSPTSPRPRVYSGRAVPAPSPATALPQSPATLSTTLPGAADGVVPLAALRGLVRFCPSGFRRRLVARGPSSLVSVLAFEPGQCERIHQHHDSGEYFHGVVGRGQLLIADTWHPIAPGGTRFRPPSTWHGVVAETRLLLVSIQAPVPSRAQTIWLDPPERTMLRPEDREGLARYGCCCCPCCGGHMRRRRLVTPCGNCGRPRTAARCENCGWGATGLCLPAEYWRAS